MSNTKTVMQSMAQAIDDILNERGKPKKNGFVLLVFPLDMPEGNRTNYISNSQRGDVVAALKEVVARFEGQAEQKGNA